MHTPKYMNIPVTPLVKGAYSGGTPPPPPQQYLYSPGSRRMSWDSPNPVPRTEQSAIKT